jgi:2-(1,2-epoxy-1,2-dihydrophenyl)acetyl-CoA isomerase
MPDDPLRMTVKDGVARIQLCRPDTANALDDAMARALADAAIRCDEEPAIRAVLLTGSGRFFCAGGDLRAFSRAGEARSAYIKRLTMFFHAALSRFARMDPPLVVSVNGIAAGAGLSLSCIGDIVLAAESASCTVAYTAAGLVPDGGSTWWIPRLVGLRLAQELMLTNRRLSADEAVRTGLWSRVVADAELEDEAATLAATLAEGPVRALGQTRRLLLSSGAESFETQMELEARAIAEAAGRPESDEGIAAFLEKREPRFRNLPR